MAAPVSLGWLGIGRELYAGTPVLPQATVPVNAGAWDNQDTPKFLDDNGIRAVMSSPAGRVMGTQSGTFSYGAPFYLDSGGWWLDNLFGDLSTVSSGTLGTAQPLAAPLLMGDTNLAVGVSLGAVTTGSVIQISDGPASEVVIATASSTGLAVNFAGTPCRFGHTTTATAALQTAAASYAHTFAVLNGGTGQPPTHTLTDTTGLTAAVGGRCYPMAALTALTLTSDPAGFISASYAGVSWISAPAASTPVPGTSFTVALGGWASTVSIGGSPAPTVGPWQVELARDLVAYWQPNSQAPSYVRGDLKATGTFAYLNPVDETPLNAMLSAGPQPVTLQASNGLPGASALSLTVQMSSTQAVKASPERSRPYLGYAGAFGANANSSDTGGTGGAGPAVVTLVNAVPAYGASTFPGTYASTYASTY